MSAPERLSGVIRYLKALNVGGKSGEGIKVQSPPNADWGWRDILGPIEVRGSGVNDPTWTQVGATPFAGYVFEIDDECWAIYHIPHDIVPGADIHFHAHWLSDGTNQNTVKWEFTYTFAKGFGQEQFSSGTTIAAEEAASGTAFTHYVTETAAVTIPGLTEPDAIIYVHLARVTNGGTENTDNIFLLTADVHYQSTNIATPGKAPGFYAT